MQGAQSESRFRGIGRYTMSFTKALIKNKGQHEVHIVLNGLLADSIPNILEEFQNLLPSDNIHTWIAPSILVSPHDTEKSYRKMFMELTREAFIESLNPDIIHITNIFEGYNENSVVTFKHFTKSIVSASLYDLIPLLNPDNYLKNNPAYEDFYYSKIKDLNKLDVLLTISEFSQKEALDHIKMNHIVNVSGAVDDFFHHIEIEVDENKELKDKFGIKTPFLMYTGGADERKNLYKLIEAYAGLIKNGYSFQLLFAGKISSEEQMKLRKKALSLSLPSNHLIFTGYVTNQELVLLYNLCELFIFPSWHEGFGLPVLEAMSCGTPFAAANTSSIPEIVEFEEALFDPGNVKEMTNKMLQILTDKDLKKRIRNHGLKQAQKFSWDKTAKTAILEFEKLFTQNRVKQNPRHIFKQIMESVSTLVKLHDIKSQELSLIAECLDKNFPYTYPDFDKNKLVWRLEGPFDSSYSLALVNREFSRSLQSLGHTVVLHSTEGPGDFEPDKLFLEKNNDLRIMWNRSKDFTSEYKADITSRLIYPPRVNDMDNKLNILHSYAWEESGFPSDWINEFNFSLDAILTLSQHVKKVMLDNGLYIPVDVGGCGVDHWQKIISSNYKIQAKQFRFLHVSSCFPRKGIELILDAYFDTFSEEDNVSLIIKTFPNPHNKVQELINAKKLKYDKPPEIIIINHELDNSDLKALYEQCHVLVATSFAEGFGLPMAEAMLSGLPVITTNWGGQLDFCNDENSWLIDYDFELARTHFDIFSSAWARPKVEKISEAMLEAAKMEKKELLNKAEAGKNLLLRNFSWVDVAKNSINSLHHFSSYFNQPQLKIGWVTTWNSRCGIATYSSHLCRSIPVESLTVLAPQNETPINVEEESCNRCWSQGKEKNNFAAIDNIISENNLNVIIIQFNYGFYNHYELRDFITDQKKSGRVIIMMMHSTVDPLNQKPEWNFKLKKIKDALNSCDRILVHTINDMNRLKNIGLINNVALFPHGIVEYKPAENHESKQLNNIPLVSSYGFCLPHKGLEQLVEAAAILKERGAPIRLRLVNAEYPAPESAQVISDLQNSIKKHNLSNLVEIINDYLPDEMSLQLLSEADLLVFPYQQTGESSSAAVRYGLATKRPVAVTPLPIFDDISNSAYQFDNFDSESIANGVLMVFDNLKSNSPKAKNISACANKWRDQHAYSKLSLRLQSISLGLLRDKNMNKKTK
jgi:glycosyltransferase involved in cell wall biosynthesis